MAWWEVWINKADDGQEAGTKKKTPFQGHSSDLFVLPRPHLPITPSTLTPPAADKAINGLEPS